MGLSNLENVALSLFWKDYDSARDPVSGLYTLPDVSSKLLDFIPEDDDHSRYNLLPEKLRGLLLQCPHLPIIIPYMSSAHCFAMLIHHTMP